MRIARPPVGAVTSGKRRTDCQLVPSDRSVFGRHLQAQVVFVPFDIREQRGLTGQRSGKVALKVSGGAGHAPCGLAGDL